MPSIHNSHAFPRLPTKIRMVMYSAMSVCSQGTPHVTITNNALDLTILEPPSPGPGPLSAEILPCQWHLVAKTRDLCKLIHLMAPTGADIWWLSTEACTVGERAVRILLKCFPVSTCLWNVKKVTEQRTVRNHQFYSLLVLWSKQTHPSSNKVYRTGKS